MRNKEDVDKIIEDALGVVDNTPRVPTVKKEEPIVPVPKEGDDIDKDYVYQRDNFYKLIEKGQTAVQGILDLAQESDHPRAYEFAGNMIKNVADVTEKLALLQEKMKKLKEVPGKAPKNVTNALFVGSTAELQKMLKKKKDD